VLPPSPGAVLLAALLAGAAQAAEPSPVPRCAATARFDLSAGSPEGAPEVCASADEPTAFVFDSRVAGGGGGVSASGTPRALGTRGRRAESLRHSQGGLSARGAGQGDGALRGWRGTGERELLACGPCGKGDAPGVCVPAAAPARRLREREGRSTSRSAPVPGGQSAASGRASGAGRAHGGRMAGGGRGRGV